MRGEMTLADALDRVGASSIKERTEGLGDLKHVLQSNSRFEALSDGSFHKIYEVLFNLTLSEQSAPLKAKTATTRSAADKRLSACASALRSAVERGVQIVKLKTVRSVLDHVAETLLLPDGGFCEPIVIDYAKSMRALLSYHPHVEHLLQADRERVALFCLDCVSRAGSDQEDDDADPGADATSITGTVNVHSYRSSRSQFKESGGSQGGRSQSKQIVEEMVACLALLTAAPNARSGPAASTILWGMVELLKKPASTGLSHVDAFRVINNILPLIRTEDTMLTRKITSPLFRLVRFYWTNKSSAVLKDEMLKTLLYLHPYLESALAEDDVTTRSEMKGLLEVMRSEYGNRQEKEQLHLDDLRLDHGPKKQHEIRTRILALRSGSVRAESNWATVYVMTALYNFSLRQEELLKQEEPRDSSDDDEVIVDPRPRKRQRLTNEIELLLGSLTSDAVPSRLCALQILALTAQQTVLSSKRIGTIIDNVSASCSEKQPSVASWGLIVLTSLATQKKASETRLSSHWTSVWQLAVRAMNNANTCRSACQLLLVMLKSGTNMHQKLTELARILTHSIDLNGPAMLADSVAHLLTYVIRVTQQSNPSSAAGVAESTLNWLFRNFVPSMFEDKRYASQQSSYDPEDLVAVIVACLGHPVHLSTAAKFPIWSSIGAVWLVCKEQEDLLQYLLLLPGLPNDEQDNASVPEIPHGSMQARINCETATLNNLIANLHRTQDIWTPMMRERPLSVSLDMLSALCSSLSVAACVAYCNVFRDERRQRQLQQQVEALLDQIVEYFSSRNCGQEKVDSMLTMFSSACSRLHTSVSDPTPRACETQICRAIHEICEARRSREYGKSMQYEDLMDIEDDYDSQDSRHGQQSNTLHVIRHESAAGYSVMSMRSSVSMYAAAISTLSIDSSLSQSSPASMVDYILSLPVDTILSSRRVVSRLPELGLDLLADDAERLLELCTVQMLQEYTYERSEVATGVILDIMSSFVPLWTNPAWQSLFDLGIDMYAWYTTTALKGGVLSPKVQERVAVLLLQLCHVDTEYGHDNDVPSVRTSLFKLLQLGTVTVLFHLAGRISTIFGFYVLSKHAEMFNDLQKSLPDDVDWVEGMSMRLLLLARLASAWHSLLRQSVFYIFETGAKVAASSKHAARCISELSSALGFGPPKELFHLFAPQLLNSWLDIPDNNVMGLPFSVFQYDSLDDLFIHNLTEVTAQLLVRGNDNGLQIVASACKTNGADLIARCFAKCLAYCIAWDIARRSGSDGLSCENRMRSMMDKKMYKTLAVAQSPTILGQFYISMQLDGVHDEWLEKRKEHAASYKALMEIKKISHSDKFLPTSQQPSFKSSRLCDQIERLCKRTSQDPMQPWEPSSFSLAARMLIDSIHDALGPLHTCLVIRKLRLLISMSANIPFSAFPLEMLIHTLRPHLSDSQCADDVIGILQYLFSHGQHYLRTSPLFLFGTITLMILKMRKHTVTRQESTTQESQHKQTVQKMQSFQVWLVEYLQDCLQQVSTQSTATYAQLTAALGRVQLPGSAQKDSPESSLLLLLIEQDGEGHPSLRSSDRNEALVLLSENFTPPSSPSEDCLSDDAECVRLGQKLWTAMHIPGVSDNFISWVAGAIGRAYASAGIRPVGSWNTKPYLNRSATKGFQGVARSHAAIVDRLSAMLYSRNRREASLADYTLRSIKFSYASNEEAIPFEQMLPGAVVPAIHAGTCGYTPDFAMSPAEHSYSPRSLRRILESSSAPTLAEWVQELSLALCDQSPKAAVIPALKAALQHDADLALELLPPIVHILLAQELGQEQTVRTQLSAAIATYLVKTNEDALPKQRYLLKLILYLRSQELPNEITDADRLRWLEVDWIDAAQAADRCGMPTTALMFAESAV